MSDKPAVGSKQWIKGGRAYGLAKLAMAATLAVHAALFVMVLMDKYDPEVNTIFLLTIASLATLGGAQQVPNMIDAAMKKRGEE